jgi:hypothetical protein
MRCPACRAENAADARRCAACGAALPRRPRRGGAAEGPDAPAPGRGEAGNRAARRAFRLVLFGLIPVAGLVLGPAAVVLGGLARRCGRADPAFTAHGPAAAAVVLGTVVTLCNWAGVVLLVLGLRGAAGP